MALTFIRCCHAIIVLLIFQNVFYFKKTFYYVLFSIWNFRIKILFLIPVYSCYMICLTECSMFGMRYAREVAYWGYGMLGMWDIGDVGCWRCGMLGMWDVGDVGCWGCGMLGMRNVQDWDVRNMGCGMWDVCRDVERWFTKFHFSS